MSEQPAPLHQDEAKPHPNLEGEAIRPVEYSYEMVEHAEWKMPMRRGTRESRGEVQSKIMQKEWITDSAELMMADPHGVEFEYDPEDSRFYGLSLPRDVEGSARFSPQAMSAAEYVHRFPSEQTSVEIRAAVAKSVEEEIPSWWLAAGRIDDHITRELFSFFQREEPAEQLIVGRNGSGFRVYNYASELTEQHVADLAKFAHIVGQYYGEKTSEIVTDVVIADVEATRNLDGSIIFELPGLILLNPGLLATNITPSDGIGSEHSYLLEVLVHEFDHLAHGKGEEEGKTLAEFAKKMGWDMDALEEDFSDWEDHVRLNEYIKPGYEYHDGVPFVDIQVGSEQVRNQLPTEYSNDAPRETSAEVNSLLMLGSMLVKQMPHARDAKIEQIQTMKLRPGETAGDNPIATPITMRPDLAPIHIQRLFGDDILYPYTPLPEGRITVLAKPFKDSQYMAAA